jgi:hypothetical protein
MAMVAGSSRSLVRAAAKARDWSQLRVPIQSARAWVRRLVCRWSAWAVYAAPGPYEREARSRAR